MYQGKTVLCAASSYSQKYYLNPDFDNLPKQIKDELQIMCVMFTAEVGGEISLEFEEDGKLELKVAADEGDILYDEIGSGLKIRKLQMDKQDLLESLELYYRVFFLGEEEPDVSGN